MNIKLVIAVSLVAGLSAATGCSDDPQTGQAEETEPGKYIFVDVGRGVRMKLVRIPAATFLMGSPQSEAGRSPNEGPQHRVTLTRDFYMGVLEVTQAQHEAVMGTNPSHYKGGDNPVDSISWDDATAFCRKLSEKTGMIVRLPTEAEWEYACRAGTSTPFSTGSTIGVNEANYAIWKITGPEAAIVIRRGATASGKFTPNAFGLYDMHGNMWEWCLDWYEPYSVATVTDPQGPVSGAARVVRGGAWNQAPGDCRSASRDMFRQDRSDRSRGFRVVMEIASTRSQEFQQGAE